VPQLSEQSPLEKPKLQVQDILYSVVFSTLCEVALQIPLPEQDSIKKAQSQSRNTKKEIYLLYNYEQLMSLGIIKQKKS
jgi:hypothetical protein